MKTPLLKISGVRGQTFLIYGTMALFSKEHVILNVNTIALKVRGQRSSLMHYTEHIIEL